MRSNGAWTFGGNALQLRGLMAKRAEYDLRIGGGAVPEIAVVSEILQWVVLIVLAGLCGGLVYLVGDLQRRVGPDRGPLIPNEGLEVGSIAPRLVGMDPRRGVHTASDGFNKPSLVAFLSPTCGPCVGLVEDLNRLAREQRDVDVLVVFSSGGVGIDFSRECSEEIRLVKDQDSRLFTAWQASKTPMVAQFSEGWD